MISKDLSIGLFIGGTIGMIACGVLNIWNAMGMAPLVLIIILDVVLVVDNTISGYCSRCEAANRRKKR